MLYVFNTGSCAGIQDLGDSQTQQTTDRLTIGAIYWVQVLVKDSCVNAGNCAPGQIGAWSNVVQVIDPPPASPVGVARTGAARPEALPDVLELEASKLIRS